MKKRAGVLALVLLAGCARAKAPAPVEPMTASIQARCLHAGNSGVRMFACESPRERAEFATILVGQFRQPVPPEHFVILREHYPVWVDVVERKTHLRGIIRFADQAVVETGGDMGVRTMPIVARGRTLAYATWCIEGEWHIYLPPQRSRASATEACAKKRQNAHLERE